MNIYSRVSFALTGALLLALPNTGTALESQFIDQFAATSAICAEDNNGAGNGPTCLRTLLPLLSNVRATTSGAQYDTEIGAMALAIVTTYNQLGNPIPEVCQTLAGALEETGKSAADQGQADQIFAIAQAVSACRGVQSNLDRLLASPN